MIRQILLKAHHCVVDGQKVEAEMEEEEVENFSLSFPPPQRSQSPKHIKLKLPMSTLAGKHFNFLYSVS